MYDKQWSNMASHNVVLDLSLYDNLTAARRILIDSLAYIINALGLSHPEDVLEELGISFDNELMKHIKRDIYDKVGKVSLSILETYQYTTQKLISNNARKTLAAYYTDHLGTGIISKVVRAYYNSVNTKLTISDPFMGSGALLHRVIKRLGTDNIRLAWGVEVEPLSCLLGYAILLGDLNNDKERIFVRCGDTFRIIWGLPQAPHSSSLGNTNVIITNPPFTRWEILPSDYRKLLETQMRTRGYANYIKRKQLSLQAISLFLIDTVLGKDGLLVSVLPASTFYTTYGEGIKAMLRDKYNVLALIQKKTDNAFSTDSGFKEVILIARKNDKVKSRTAFITINNEDDIKNIKFNRYDLEVDIENRNSITHEDLTTVPHLINQNWLLLFNPELKPLIKLITELNSKGLLRPFSEVFSEDVIVRGVEMYGPNFFLIPNNYFTIIETKSDYIAIKQVSTGEALEIPREFLVPALRKPSLYKSRIVIKDPGYYLLSIPPVSIETLPNDIRKYIELGTKLNTTKTAENAFGRYWYSHVHKQIRAKRPFGHVFIPDKVDSGFKNRGVYAVMSWEPLTATKNFYIVMNREYAPALTLWFNSSLFLALLIHGSRKISETWTRYLEQDILNLPIPNKEIMNKYTKEAESLVREFSSSELPPFKMQVYAKVRHSIDNFILDILEIRGTQRKWFMEYTYQLL